MSRKRFGRNQKRKLREQIQEVHTALEHQESVSMRVRSENRELKKTLTRLAEHFTEITRNSVFLTPERVKNAPDRVMFDAPAPRRPFGYSEAGMLMEKSFFINDKLSRIQIKMEETQNPADGKELFYVHMIVDNMKELTYCVNKQYLRDHGLSHLKENISDLFDDALGKWRLKR